MYIFILGLILGFAFKMILDSLFDMKSLKFFSVFNKKENILRRGIYLNEYITRDKTLEFAVQYEIGEIERTKDKSKIVVLSATSGSSVFGPQKRNLIERVNYSWIDSSQIEWIEHTISDKRNEKINDLLK